MIGVIAAAVLALITVTITVVRLRRSFVQVTVSGTSMQPTYRPGDRVLVRRTNRSRLSVGDVVVLCPQDSEDWLIKRVASLTPGGDVFVLGDAGGNSNDSRRFGAVPASRVLGVAIRVRRSGIADR